MVTPQPKPLLNSPYSVIALQYNGVIEQTSKVPILLAPVCLLQWCNSFGFSAVIPKLHQGKGQGRLDPLSLYYTPYLPGYFTSLNGLCALFAKY